MNVSESMKSIFLKKVSHLQESKKIKQNTFKSFSLDLKGYLMNVIGCEVVFKVKYKVVLLFMGKERTHSGCLIL